MKCIPDSSSILITDSIGAVPSKISVRPRLEFAAKILVTPGRLRSQSIKRERPPERATLRASDVAKTVLPSAGRDEVTSTIFGGLSTSEYRKAVRTDRMASE